MAPTNRLRNTIYALGASICVALVILLCEVYILDNGAAKECKTLVRKRYEEHCHMDWTLIFIFGPLILPFLYDNPACDQSTDHCHMEFYEGGESILVWSAVLLGCMCGMTSFLTYRGLISPMQ